MLTHTFDRDDLSNDPISLIGKSRERSWLSTSISLVFHALILATVVLAPIFFPEEAPGRPDLVRVLLYDPPPPPPPPLPRGRPEGPRQETPRLKSTVDKPGLSLPEEIVMPESLLQELNAELDRFGSLMGSDLGSLDGMEEGVPGGEVGGVPGGVIGGVPWGKGNGVVQDVDSPARVIRQTTPDYPKEAFVKRIEGVVRLEVVIDEQGRVKVTKVLQSIPLLNAAAIACVRQWIFRPATKHGHPVASLGEAPITFKIR